MDDTRLDFYRVLGVPTDATAQEIHAAYRREAKNWHPDRNQVAGAAERFKLIGTAYHTLADEDRRHAYDDTLVPNLVFVPDVIDLGNVRPGDEPREVTVALRNHGYAYDPGTVIAFEDPADGPFWQVYAVGYDEDAEDPRTLCLYSFETDVDPVVYVAPGFQEDRTEARLICEGRTYVAELRIRVNVLAETNRPADTVVDRRPTYVAPAPPPTGRLARISPGLASAYGCGLLVIVFSVVMAIIAVFFFHSSPTAHPAADQELQPPPVSAGSTVALPAKFPTANSVLLPDGELFQPDNGRSITLVRPDGRVKWSKPTIANYAQAAASQNCAVIVSANGTGDMVSLDTGAQTPVPIPISGATDSPANSLTTPAMSGDTVAWGDGTIRNACTGIVVDTAAPSGRVIGVPRCLIGSLMITSAGSQQFAWEHGVLRWRMTSETPLLCDAQGTIIQPDGVGHLLNLIDPKTGTVRWTATDTTCRAAQDAQCGVANKAPLSLHEAGNVIFVSSQDDFLAIAANSGDVLWDSTGLRCVLAARSTPKPLVLLGPCGGFGAQFPTIATVADPSTGKPITNIQALSDTNGLDSVQWVANEQHLAVITPRDNASPAASLIDW